MKKEIKTKTDYFIEFSDEEIQSLGWKEGQKFTVEERGVRVSLVPLAEVEIELSELSREVLEWIITESCEKDISANSVVEMALKWLVDGGGDFQPPFYTSEPTLND